MAVQFEQVVALLPSLMAVNLFVFEHFVALLPSLNL